MYIVEIQVVFALHEFYKLEQSNLVSIRLLFSVYKVWHPFFIFLNPPLAWTICFIVLEETPIILGSGVETAVLSK